MVALALAGALVDDRVSDGAPPETRTAAFTRGSTPLSTAPTWRPR